MHPNDPVVVAPSAVETVLHRAWEPDPPVFLLSPDGTAPAALIDAVRAGAGLAVGRGPSHWVVRRRVGRAVPVQGPWALSGEALRIAVPLGRGSAVGIGLAIDVVRAGLGVREVELPGTSAGAVRLGDALAVSWSRRLRAFGI